MSYRLIDANALNGVISNDDYEKVLNAPCIFADLPNGLDGGHYNLQEPILDKIRAEIEEYKSRQLTLAIGVKDLEEGKQIALEYVLAILDKYKAESEE